jgi:hypothetical protein
LKTTACRICPHHSPRSHPPTPPPTAPARPAKGY